ncbi:MAG: hypothetical protein H0S78_13900, partial [Tissierellales bacterium]|nr:hypothetical protein [Tissierellales bacterium]
MKKKSIIILIISIILIYPILGFSSDTAESDDPLITLSYLDYRLDEVNSEFSENISNQSIIVEDLESTIKEQAELISSLKDDINN